MSIPPQGTTVPPHPGGKCHQVTVPPLGGGGPYTILFMGQVTVPPLGGGGWTRGGMDTGGGWTRGGGGVVEQGWRTKCITIKMAMAIPSHVLLCARPSQLCNYWLMQTGVS